MFNCNAKVSWLRLYICINTCCDVVRSEFVYKNTYACGGMVDDMVCETF